jgi:hypothetical protein
MKKILQLLVLVTITINAIGQNSIPNGKFELWDTANYQYPTYYQYTSDLDNFYANLPFNVSQTTDAYQGSYAVQLTTIVINGDSSAGYFLNLNPNNSKSNNLTGGVGITQKPTGISGWYKYNVATSDSATIIVSFTLKNVNIGTYSFHIGGIHRDYVPFHYSFNPPLAFTPDTVGIAVIASLFNPNSNNNGGPVGPPGDTLKLDSITFTGVNSQPADLNGSFESWQSQLLTSPEEWYTQNNDGEGVRQTSGYNQEQYAVELTTYLGSQNNHTEAQPGEISTGYYPNNCDSNCYQMGGYGFTQQTDTLAFYYKYVPSGNDKAVVQLTFVKDGFDISYQSIDLSVSSAYQYEELAFDIGEAPDSVIVDIVSSSWNDTLLSFVGSQLTIDDIHFKSQVSTGIVTNKNTNSISVYPNPVTDQITIENTGSEASMDISIYNLQGQEIIHKSANTALENIDVSTIESGLYIIKIINNSCVYTKQFVKE